MPNKIRLKTEPHLKALNSGQDISDRQGCISTKLYLKSTEGLVNSQSLRSVSKVHTCLAKKFFFSKMSSFFSQENERYSFIIPAPTSWSYRYPW